MDYIILYESDLQQLQRVIQARINAGWNLYGPLISGIDSSEKIHDNHVWAQAMTRDK